MAYKIFGAEVSFALKIGEIPENSAFIIELKHFKEKSKKVSTKCWSYIDTRAVFEKITIENNAGREVCGKFCYRWRLNRLIRVGKCGIITMKHLGYSQKSLQFVSKSIFWWLAEIPVVPLHCLT